jgi:hypothetical protein
MTTPVAADEARILQAHAKLAHDSSLQFDLAHPREPPPPPAWLHWVGDMLHLASPVLRIVFWGGLIAVALLIAWFLVREIVRFQGGALGKGPKLGKEPAAPAWRPSEAAARTLLADADRLAAEGQFAEATHLLLLRSIDDLDSRKPRTVRPALTARDIAGLDALPDAARPAFTSIAQVVEASLFGGAPVDAAGYADCRRAYEDFALPAGWTQ